MACFPNKGGWRPGLGALVALGLAVFLSPGRTGAAEEGQPFLRVTVESGLLGLEARAVPRGEVLQAIGDAAGFVVLAGPSGTELVDLSMTKLPVDRAVSRLLQGTSAVMLYAPDPESGPARLTEVRLLASQGQSKQIRRNDRDHGKVPRLEAVHALSRRADAASVEALAVTAGHDPDPTVRRAAVDALGELRIGKARAALIGALSDEDPHVRRRAVAALLRTWGEKAAAPLARLLSEGEDPDMRRLAADALARIGGETALAGLMKAQTDPDAGVRRAVAAGLAGHEDPAG